MMGNKDYERKTSSQYPDTNLTEVMKILAEIKDRISSHSNTYSSDRNASTNLCCEIIRCLIKLKPKEFDSRLE